MKRTILAAALVMGATTAMSSAADLTAAQSIEAGTPTFYYDATLGEKFEVKREIVDRAQALWGEYPAYETPQELPDTVNAEIVPGQQLPADAPTAEVPEAMGDLPTLADGGSHWVASGNHLIEVADDNTVVMVVYNALP
jgi:hypothetical protein